MEAKEGEGRRGTSAGVGLRNDRFEDGRGLGGVGARLRKAEECCGMLRNGAECCGMVRNCEDSWK